MIVYKDMGFCMRECGNIECTRNKIHIQWENELPVSYLRCTDCINWENGLPVNYLSCADCSNLEPVRSREVRDYYETEYSHNKQLDWSEEE